MALELMTRSPSTRLESLPESDESIEGLFPEEQLDRKKEKESKRRPFKIKDFR
jgi:hypothetical protein